MESIKPASCFQANSNPKRQKVSHPNYAAYQKQGIRRSTRHRKVRGEKALLVSANQTLKDLKIQVSHLEGACRVAGLSSPPDPRREESSRGRGSSLRVSRLVQEPGLSCLSSVAKGHHRIPAEGTGGGSVTSCGVGAEGGREAISEVPAILGERGWFSDLS